MEHQVEQLRAGTAPDDLIDPKRARPAHAHVAQGGLPGGGRVQRGIGLELGFAPR